MSHIEDGDLHHYEDDEEDENQVICCGCYDRKPGLKYITALWALWTMALLATMTLGIMSQLKASYLDIPILLVDIYAFCVLINAVSTLDSNSVMEDAALKKASQSMAIAVAVLVMARLT